MDEFDLICVVYLEDFGYSDTGGIGKSVIVADCTAFVDLLYEKVLFGSKNLSL